MWLVPTGLPSPCLIISLRLTVFASECEDSISVRIMSKRFLWRSVDKGLFWCFCSSKPGTVNCQFFSRCSNKSLDSRVEDFLCFAKLHANVVTESMKSSAISKRKSSTSGFNFPCESTCETKSCIFLFPRS